jgi:hypothetical protein
VGVLVTLTELKTYLGDAPTSSDDALLTQLINDVEALFASETVARSSRSSTRQPHRSA